jgi:hypothetical protein
MSGSGMKQGRQARGGSERTERLRKPEGASDLVRQTRSRCCCRGRGHAEGEQTSWEEPLRPTGPERDGGGAAARGSVYSVGAHKPMRGQLVMNIWTLPAAAAGEIPGAQPIGSKGKRDAPQPIPALVSCGQKL